MALSETLREVADRVRNWGRWGDDDQVGTLNLIDPAAVLRGAACVTDGKRFRLAVDLRRDGIQCGQPANRINPVLSFNSLNERDPKAPGIWTGSDDLITMSTCAGTHIDGLAHVAYEGRLYGDRDTSTISAASGATWCGIEQLPPIVSRALLCDIPRHLGIDWIEPSHAVTPDQLDACLADAGLEVEPGDVILVRTGDLRHYLDNDDRRRYATGVNWQLPGLHPDCIEWFHARDVAAVFNDTYSFEVFPPPSGNWDDMLAVHMLHLRDMGLVQGQNWFLEELAADSAEDGRYASFLVAAPEPIVGAVSAPIAPVAIK